MRFAFALLLLSITVSAQAQLLLPKNAKATLVVEYVYVAEGTSGKRNGTDSISEWKVRQAMNITAQYVSEQPVAIAVIHQAEPAQQASLDKKVSQAEALGAKMQPTVSDMMAIADRCGEDEGCIERAVAEYSKTVDVKALRERNAEAQAFAKPDAPRYQLWKLTAQSGTYEVDELTTLQVFEATCTLKSVCKRTVTRRGKGPIPRPPGGNVEGTSLLEIDSVKKTIAARMPVPLAELAVDTQVQSNIPDDDFKPAPVFPQNLLKSSETLMLAIDSGALPATGTTSIKKNGRGAESGTLTIKWTFKRG